MWQPSLKQNVNGELFREGLCNENRNGVSHEHFWYVIRATDDLVRHKLRCGVFGRIVGGGGCHDVRPMTSISGRTLLQLAFLTCRAGRADAIRVCNNAVIYRRAVSPMLQLPY